MKNDVVFKADDHDLTSNNNMTSANGHARHASAGHVQSTLGTQHSSESASPEPGGGHHPPMDIYAFPAQPKYAPTQAMGLQSNYYQHPPHQSDNSFFPQALQYNAQLSGFYNATSAHQTGPHTHPDPRFYNHPPAHLTPQCFYGSWPGANDAPIQNNVYYNPTPYKTIPPPDAVPRRGSASGRGKASKKSKDHQRQPSYGSLELNVHDAVNEHLLSALTFVRSNPKATLFDIDGKS
jgi:hypothetical protein